MENKSDPYRISYCPPWFFSSSSPRVASQKIASGRMEAEKRRRANIHVLRSYYGDTENASESHHSDPTNVDDPAFDVADHLSKLLETQSVKGLLKADEETLREIKKLDSDMKTLVYENYNKFISATDTIRKMKSNVENMQEEMGKLAANMEKIEECTNHINNTLAPSREKIRELSGVYRLLKKVCFIPIRYDLGLFPLRSFLFCIVLYCHDSLATILVRAPVTFETSAGNGLLQPSSILLHQNKLCAEEIQRHSILQFNTH